MAFKGKLKQKTLNGSEILHPESEAEVILYSKTIEGTAVTNVKDALDKIATGIGVTGVKGNAESNYRTGQVNLTPANIGAEAAFTDGSATIASVSSDVVTLKAGVAQSSGAISNSSGSDITLAKVAKTGSYTDLSDKPTIGNKTLTIKAGGTLKGTFTANQSATDVEVDITAADLGLSSALLFLGTTTSSITDGSTTNPISISGSNVTATSGNVVLKDNKEFLWNGTAWEELGDESSHALKTVKIQAGTGLTGGGTLEADRTLALADNYGDTKNPYASKTKNYVLAAPSAQAGAPTFRALVASDIPDLSATYQPLLAALGSTTKPVYVSAAGVLAEAATYAGGTKVTLNGTDKGGSTASFYAPTSVANMGQYDTSKHYLYFGSSTRNDISSLLSSEDVYVKQENSKVYLYSRGLQVLTGNQTITLSGDATGSGATSIAVTLKDSGVTAGTYSAVTVDAKGRVTSGGQVFEVINNGGTPSVPAGGLYFEKDA